MNVGFSPFGSAGGPLTHNAVLSFRYGPLRARSGGESQSLDDEYFEFKAPLSRATSSAAHHGILKDPTSLHSRGGPRDVQHLQVANRNPRERLCAEANEP
jgi:hypothetical protein